MRQPSTLCLLAVLTACAQSQPARPAAPQGVSGALVQRAPADARSAAWKVVMMPRRIELGSTFLFAGKEAVTQVAASGLQIHADADEGEVGIGVGIAVRRITSVAVGEAGVLMRDVLGRLFVAPSTSRKLAVVEGLIVRGRAIDIGARYGFACADDGALVRIQVEAPHAVSRLSTQCIDVYALEDVFVVNAEGKLLRSENDGDEFQEVGGGRSDVTGFVRFGGGGAVTTGGERIDLSGKPWAPASSGGFGFRSQTMFINTSMWSHEVAQAQRARFGPQEALRSTTLSPSGEIVRNNWPLGYSCRRHEQHGRPLLACVGGHGLSLPSETIFALGDKGWSEAYLRRPADDPDDWYFSRRAPDTPPDIAFDDHGGMVVEAACSDADAEGRGDDDSDGGYVVCWRTPGNETSTTLEPGCEARDDDSDDDIDETDRSDSVDLLSLYRDTLVYQDCASDYRTANLATGENRVLVTHAEAAMRPRFFDSTLIWGHSVDGGRVTLVRASTAHDETRRSLPAGAVSFDFATPSRGMAAGRNASELWVTEDGGATWKPITVKMDGHPSQLPVADVSCMSTLCDAGPVAWLDPRLLPETELEPIIYVGPARPATAREVVGSNSPELR